MTTKFLFDEDCGGFRHRQDLNVLLNTFVDEIGELMFQERNYTGEIADEPV